MQIGQPNSCTNVAVPDVSGVNDAIKVFNLGNIDMLKSRGLALCNMTFPGSERLLLLLNLTSDPAALRSYADGGRDKANVHGYMV
jgi:hypothetical protein